MWILMEPKDIRNRVIKEGGHVKYLGTNTTGVVEDICFKGEKTWIKIDKTGLYYLSEYLMVVEPLEDHLKIKNSKKDIINLLKPSKNFKNATSTEISDHNDGPGYGGG
jgi:hypothetical protein